MSLINKMLKDLDKRGGDNAGADAARASVKAVSLGGRKKGRPMLWISLLVLVALVAAAGWVFRDKVFKRVPPVVKSAPVPLVSSAPPLVTATPPVATGVAKSTEPGKSVPDTVVQPPRVATVVATPAAKSMAPASTVAAKPAMPPTAATVPSVPVKAAPAPTSTAATQTKKTLPPASAATTRVASASAKTTLPAPATIAEEKIAAPKRTAARKSAKRGAGAAQAKQASIEVTPQQQADKDYGKAIALIEAGRNAEAMAVLEGILMKQYKHAAARQTLAGLLIDAKRSSDAVKVLKDGLRVDSTQTGMAMILARLQVDKGDNRAALATLQQSLPYAKTKPDYQAFIAALYQRDNRHKEAIEHYRAAVGESPDNGVWWMGYGISLKAAGRTADARVAFSQARDSGKLTPPLKAFVDQQLAVLPQ